MTGPCRTADAPDAPPYPAARTRGGSLRPGLWLLLVVSATANAVTSTINTPLGVGFGLLALGTAVTLIVHHYRSRRRQPWRP